MSPDGIHLYRVDLRLPCHDDGGELLSADERQRAQAFRFEHLRVKYIRCRSTLRCLLGRYLSLPADQVTFAYAHHGKPGITLIQNPWNLQFNVSHSADMALMAFGAEHNLGADIEAIKTIAEMDSIAQHHFSRREYRDYLTLPEPERVRAFYTIWTRKEAFIKAIGEGMSYPLAQFDVSFLPDELPCIQAIRQGPWGIEHWSMQSLSFTESGQNFIGACVHQGSDQTIRGFHWRQGLIEPMSLNTGSNSAPKPSRVSTPTPPWL